MFKVVSFLFVSLFITGCNSQKSPEQVLTKYINLRLSTEQSRDGLSSYLTGEMLDGVMSLSTDEYKAFISSTNIKKKKLKINHKRCSSDKCFLTYTLKYSSPKEGDEDYLMSVKKIAEIVKDEEMWKISKVSDLKSHLESFKPIEVK
mgnify:CR=1 FL=1